MKIAVYTLLAYLALTVAAFGQAKFIVVAPSTVKIGTPVDVAVQFQTQWPHNHPAVTWTVNGLPSAARFTPSAPGKYTVTAHAGNATATAEVRALPKQVLIFGNSISIDPPDYQLWWMAYGMAASDPAHDYVHVLAGMYGANVIPHYCGDWETGHSGFNYSKYDGFFSPVPDLIIIRLGENAPNDLVNYEQDFTALVNYAHSKAPNATINISGEFWIQLEKDAIHERIAHSLNFLYTSLIGLDTLDNEAAIGEMVTGDDGHLHAINHGAVAHHPGDKGMAAIASTLYAGTFQ